MSGPVGNGSGDIARSSLGAGVRFRPRAPVAVQCHWEQRRYPEILHTGFFDQAWSASLNLRSDLLRTDGRVILLRGLLWEASALRAWYREAGEAAAPQQYALAPRGSASADQMSLTWTVQRMGTALVRRSRATADVEGNASYGGERFGRLSYARCDLESYLFAIQPASSGPWRAFAEAEIVSLEGKARAKVETWPFTPTLVDLLGHRRICEADGRARWTRWHIAAERGLGAGFAAKAGVSWYDIRPQFVVDSWRPAFLVFGRSDFQRDELEVNRVQLATVSAGASYAAPGWGVDLAVQQFVFARANDDRARGSGDAGPAPTQKKSAGGAPGGTRVLVAMTLRF